MGTLSNSRLEPEIEAVVKSFVEKKVVVIGDLMVDEYIKGDVRRLSSEMPVPLLLRPGIPPLDGDLVRLGGAGNTARNIASFGAEVVLIGVCGDDTPAGTQMMSLAAIHNPKASGHRLKICCRIVKQRGLITTHKLRLISSQFVQLFRVDTESEQKIDERTIHQILRYFKAACKWAHIVVVTDYAKGFITKELFAKLRNIAAGKHIIVDPKEPNGGARFDKYWGADIIIPNESELRRSFNYSDKLDLE